MRKKSDNKAFSSKAGIITELRIRRNTRYQKNDKAIVLEILSDPVGSKVATICRNAHITRLVFYKHYRCKSHAIIMNRKNRAIY